MKRARRYSKFEKPDNSVKWKDGVALHREKLSKVLSIPTFKQELLSPALNICTSQDSQEFITNIRFLLEDVFNLRLHQQRHFMPVMRKNAL